MTEHLNSADSRALPGRIFVFLIGRSVRGAAAAVPAKKVPLSSAPIYTSVISPQTELAREPRQAEGVPFDVIIKAFHPDAIVAEASLEREDILSDVTRELKRNMVDECREVLVRFGCRREMTEDYTAYCISGYQGDPEVYLSLHGERIAEFLKNESEPLDEEEVRATLSTSLKYGRDDITIIDWDGAFIFDSRGDFEENIRLFRTANLQLLRSRMLAEDLDARLEHTLGVIRVPRGLPFIRTRVVRQVLKEIIEIRTQSLLESEAVERNIRLIGDWYSARLYALIAKKFHLDEWRTMINEKLDTLEDAYTMAAENFSVSYRATLEFIILAGWFILLLLYVGEFLLAR